MRHLMVIEKGCRRLQVPFFLPHRWTRSDVFGRRGKTVDGVSSVFRTRRIDMVKCKDSSGCFSKYTAGINHRVYSESDILLFARTSSEERRACREISALNLAATLFSLARDKFASRFGNVFNSVCFKVDETSHDVSLEQLHSRFVEVLRVAKYTPAFRVSAPRALWSSKATRFSNHPITNVH